MDEGMNTTVADELWRGVGQWYVCLQGETLSGEATWNGDVVQLEKAVFQQVRSRYELQGQYTLPPETLHATRAAESRAAEAFAGSASASATPSLPSEEEEKAAEERGEPLKLELLSHPVTEVKRVPWTPGGRWKWRMEVRRGLLILSSKPPPHGLI